METLIGKIEITSKEEVHLRNEETNKSLFEGRGAFSGTDVCECGEKVIYGVKRSDGAELGACSGCGKPYIGHKGNRLKFEHLDMIIN